MEKTVKVYAKAQNRLALGIVKAYIAMHPDTTLEDLREHFPNSLNPDSGVKENFVTEEDTNYWKDHTWKGYFMKDDELLVLKDGVKAALVSMWTKPSVERLVSQAKEYGIEGIKSEDAASGTYKIEKLEDADGQDGSSKKTDKKIENPMEIYLYGQDFLHSFSNGMTKEEWENFEEEEANDSDSFGGPYSLKTMGRNFVVCSKEHADREADDYTVDRSLNNALNKNSVFWLEDSGGSVEEIELNKCWYLDSDDSKNPDFPKNFPDEYKKNLAAWEKTEDYENYAKEDSFELRSLFDLCVPPAPKGKPIHTVSTESSVRMWKVILEDVDEKDFDYSKLSFIRDSNTEVECLDGELDHCLLGVVYDGKWYGAKECVDENDRYLSLYAWAYEEPDYYGFYTYEGLF